jgi:hypothetical protein
VRTSFRLTKKIHRRGERERRSATFLRISLPSPKKANLFDKKKEFPCLNPLGSDTECCCVAAFPTLRVFFKALLTYGQKKPTLIIGLNLKKSLASCLLLNTIFHVQLVSAQNLKTQALPDADLLNLNPAHHLQFKSPSVFLSPRPRVSFNDKSSSEDDMTLVFTDTKNIEEEIALLYEWTTDFPGVEEWSERHGEFSPTEATLPSPSPSQQSRLETSADGGLGRSQDKTLLTKSLEPQMPEEVRLLEKSDRPNTAQHQDKFPQNINSVRDIPQKFLTAENLGVVELTPAQKNNWNQAQQDTSTPASSNPEVDDVLNKLDALPQQKFSVKVDTYRSSPGFTISNPNGYGADNNTIFLAADYQRRTRFTKKSDGELGFGVGLWNSVKAVGVELAYTINSFGTSRSEFGSGAFSVKVHRRIAEDMAVAVGWNQFARIERNPDAPLDYPKNSYYAVLTKIFKTQKFINEPFSRVAITVGIGGGQFLDFDRINEAFIKNEGPTGLGVFGSVGVRIFQPVSMIVEWTGQDLGAGLSIVPFKNIPLVITPAIRDISGAGDGARFILGTGVSLQL